MTATPNRVTILLADAVQLAESHSDIDRPKDAIRIAYQNDINDSHFTTDEKVAALNIFADRQFKDIEDNGITRLVLRAAFNAAIQQL